MLGLILECTVRAALIIAGTALVLYALRVKDARVRHSVWTAVALVMLSLPLWTAWGPEAPIPILPPLHQTTVEGGGSPLQPSTMTSAQQGPASSIPPATRSSMPRFEQVLFAVYLFGVFVFLGRLALGTARANELTRHAERQDGQWTSAACAAPVTIGWFSPVVILPEGWQQWPEARLDAVLVHEQEHARRRDPLVQWVASLNRSIFWFHPAAWWLERQLSKLAEEACDAVVVFAQGCDPRQYAETLIEMARAVSRSGVRVNVAGLAMPGADLSQRIRRIVDGVPPLHIPRKRMVCLAATCALTFAVFAAGKPGRLRQNASEAARRPEFNAASVKQNKTTDLGLAFRVLPGGRLSATNVPLKNLVGSAYQLSFGQARELKFPSGMGGQKFDIEATADGTPSHDEVMLMLQSLLADRFGLVVHWETQQLPVYLLMLVTPGKLGPQLFSHTDNTHCREASPAQAPLPESVLTEALPICGGGFGQTYNHISAEVTMEQLAKNLSYFRSQIDRPVLDRTGLKGTFDLTFDAPPVTLPPGAALPNTPAPGTDARSPEDLDIPSIYTVLRETLGLKLEQATGPVEVLVIDHVQEPSPN
jgi:bla regulator protein BlaR1